jgi:hydroxylamine reductase
MFCRQCEQTKDHVACTTVGICGKTAETAAIQDTLMHAVKTVSLWAVAARDAGATPEELYPANVWTLRATFSTLTNVNFSADRIAEFVQQGMQLKQELQALVTNKSGTAPSGEVADLDLNGWSTEDLEEFGHSVSVPVRQALMGNEDCFSLTEIATYGAKGVCAYAAHCHQLGKMDDEVMKGIHQVFSKLASNEADMEGLLANALKVGAINTQVLAMLDQGHADSFGDPEPTKVKLTATAGKCILVSGHDLVDLEALLKQTDGTGVNVYTHGEMLPAHSYPGLKKYKHLVGNYGTAWQNQKFEFAGFPGPIIVTTNCIVEPRRIYKKRLYTMNEVGYDGVQHIGEDRDYSQVIEQAKSMKGFPRTVPSAEGDYHTVGFNHRAVLPLADDIIAAAKSGVLSRIVLIGGCDGSQWDRK